jgi:hypothetical protein
MMSARARPQFSRRDLLKVAGACLSVPAFLQRAFAAPASEIAPNLVLLMQTNGTHQTNFWPTASFDSPILHRLLSDPVLAAKTTLIKGLSYHAVTPPSGNEHDHGFHGLYSGYDCVGENGASYPGGPSLDQVVVRNVAFPGRLKNLHCGVHAVNYRAINAGRLSFSASDRKQQLPCELDLYALYAKVFGSSTAGMTPERARVRLMQRRSVLDAVAQDLKTLERRLGPDERNKVAMHLSAVRDFEQRLSTRLTASFPGCDGAQPAKLGVPTTGQGNEANAPELLRLFMEFIAITVACNMVGVLSFQFGRGGDHFHYDWLNIPGMPGDAHDLVAHKDSGDPEVARINTEIKKWYTELVADLVGRLESFPQGDGKSALDNTLVVWGNELATGPHGMNDMPVALIGGARGRLQRTGYLVDEGLCCS